MNSDIIGILPCAGRQNRMKELVFAKELLPLFDGKPVIQHSIDALRRVTAHLIAVVNPKKKDLITYLKDQNIQVILDPHPQGLPDGIYKGIRPCRHFLFALPDTYYQPEDAFVRLVDHPQDNVIGLFLSNSPQNFDSVRTYKDRITAYQVKVDPPLSPWTMGCGKLAYPHRLLLAPPPRSDSEHLLGTALDRLVGQKLLYGIKYPDSLYFDLGTPRSYMDYIVNRFVK